MAQSSQAQGAAFETLFHELLTRVISQDLKFELLQNSVQGSGSQYGKDIQTRWRFPDGTEGFWHFECKSHRDSPLHQREVADKLIDIYRSAHSINVWCLALANVEPGTWIDEVVAVANEQLKLPFHLAVLSPERNFIKDVFACHPDLFTQLYPQEPLPVLNSSERHARIKRFAAFLDTHTRTGKEQALRPHGPWELISPKRLGELVEVPAQRESYLRGFAGICPWEAVVHKWVVERHSAERPLLKEIEGSGAGFNYRCIIGAAGEGKSTILRRVAWVVANKADNWTVLWAGPENTEQAARLPVKWLDSLGEGAKVLLCVDGSRHLTGVAAALDGRWRFQTEGKRIFLLLTDRGNEWFRSPIRMQFSRRARAISDHHVSTLNPLEVDEQEELARLLARRGLLFGKPLEVAIQRLRTAANRAKQGNDISYLLPTLMQLTDPEDRGFEAILASLLEELQQAREDGALRILLATSVLHGADLGFPQRLANRLIGSDQDLSTSLAVLHTEIAKQQFRTPSQFRYDPRQHLLFLHHRVIAEGILRISLQSMYYRDALLNICRAIPETMRQDLDHLSLLPEEDFYILDQTTEYLDRIANMHAVAAAWVSAWIDLDGRRFPSIHRLAECYLRWLQGVLTKDHDPSLVTYLYEAAQNAYALSIQVAGEVLLQPGGPPPPFTTYRYRDHEMKAYHGWSVLEGTVAMNSADSATRRRHLLRSILLSLLALEPNNRRQNALACGTLALSLINLGEYVLAAKVTAAEIDLKNATHIINHHKRALNERGLDIPSGGIRLLDDVLGSLTTGPLLSEWEETRLVADSRQHAQQLLDILDRAVVWIPKRESIERAISQIKLGMGS